MAKHKINFLLLVLFFAWALAASPSYSVVANDPTRIAVSARALGMGRAYIGLPGDIGSMYLNPAGIADINNFQATTMAGKFVNDVNYTNAGAAIPLGRGAISFGIVASSIGFSSSIPTIEIINGDRRIVPSGSSASYSYLNDVFLASCGFPVTDKLSTGLTLKLYSQNISGTSLAQGDAIGKNIDFGLKFALSPSINTALVLQNVLPASMGGNILWQNNNQESLLKTLKLGASFNVIGEKGIRKIGTHSLLFAVDYDASIGTLGVPGLLHMGAEWSPASMLKLRAGIDQDNVGNGNGGLETASNLTAGIGLLVGEFTFDYAYHQYYGLQGNDSNYFSVSYAGKKAEKPKPAAKKIIPKDFIEVLSPVDKTITYNDKATIKGRILAKEYVASITVNSTKAAINNEDFSIEVPLAMMKNGFVVSAIGEKGKILEKNNIRILRLKTFKDLKKNYLVKNTIEEMATLNLIDGYPKGKYKGKFIPGGPITRAEFVTVLVKAEDIEAPAPQKIRQYKDIKAQFWARKYIRKGTDLGVVIGYPNKNFRPERNINRAEAAAIAARVGDLEIPSTVESKPYYDVPIKHWAVKEIEAAKTAGSFAFVKKGFFEPKKAMRRGEAVQALSQTRFISEKISGLLDWEKGYFDKGK